MNENNTSVSDADLEQNSSDGSMAEKKAKGSNPPYDINVHSIRNRLADPDGISAKAAIDGLVKGGILEDDSAKYVGKVSFTQEKGSEEKTIIEIIGL